jgi:hypothetical protein
MGIRKTDGLNAIAYLKHTQELIANEGGELLTSLPRRLDEIRREELWRQWKRGNGKPFESFTECLTASQPHGLGMGQYHTWITPFQAYHLCGGFKDLQAAIRPEAPTRIDEATAEQLVAEIIRRGGAVCRETLEAIAAIDPLAARAAARDILRSKVRQPPDAVAIADRVRDEIRRAGRPVGRRELLRMLRVPAASLDEALRLWVHSGWIRASTDNATGGRPRIVFEPDDPTKS